MALATRTKTALRLHRIGVSALSVLRPASSEAYYQSPDAVRTFGEADMLFAPELAVMERLGDWLKHCRMLDVGVGGGRTTSYFAPMVRTYIGVDYSAPLIATCQARYAGSNANVQFSVADVRDLHQFGDGSFDFVLFSFNGLDCVPSDDRHRALLELHRVCAPAGFVFFSSHNLNWLPHLFCIQPGERRSAIGLAGAVVQQALLRIVNRPGCRSSRQEHAIVREPYSDFRAQTYFVRPAEQLRQSRAAGFETVDVYGFDGRRLERGGIEGAQDVFLHYLVTRRDR